MKRKQEDGYCEYCKEGWVVLRMWKEACKMC